MTQEKKQERGTDIKHCESRGKTEVKKVKENYSKRKTGNLVSGQSV